MPTGIILPHLGPSQLTEEVLDTLVDSNINFSLYYESIVQPYRPIAFPQMNISECLYFSGTLICTTLFSIQYALSSLQHVKVIGYIYDPPWMRGNTNYINNLRLLRNENLLLCTRSEEYANLIKKYTGRQVSVLSLPELILNA